MTPYAELLLLPTADDASIRQRFHVLSRTEHPDRLGTNGRPVGAPGERWIPVTQAYSLIKTATLRKAWERSQALLAGRCKTCRGAGVQGSRITSTRICASCAGEGVELQRVSPQRRKK